MIIRMSKVFIVVHRQDRARLVDRLGQLGFLHFKPVNPDEAVADDEMLGAIANLDRAMEILRWAGPAGPAGDNIPNVAAMDTAQEVIRIRSDITENQNRLEELHRLADQSAMWGRVNPGQIEALLEDGIQIYFLSVPAGYAGQVQAECMEPLGRLPGGKTLLAVADRSGKWEPPEWAESLSPPSKTQRTILEEAKKTDADLKAGFYRLSQLAHRLPDLQAERSRLVEAVEFVVAQRSGLTRKDLFAVQGWVPTEAADDLTFRLSEAGVAAAVQSRVPETDEVPPTLIRYPKWAMPIKGLFDILGTLPGYREIDLSPFFMVAMPVFAAMLIGDAGYGLLITAAGVIFHGKLVGIAGKPGAQLVVIVGVAALVWGILTANYFGISPETLARAGGFVQSNGAGETIDYEALWSGSGVYSRASKLIRGAAPLWRQNSKQARMIIIKFSLVIGFLHLILAHLRRLVEWIPDQRALAELGWLAALTAMMVVIWHLLFVGVNQVPAAVGWIFAGALLLTSCFGRPAKNPGKRVLFGLASSLLPLLGTFSDTMSYIRLFAVGLASYYIASAFNTLGARVAEMATWTASVPILLFGHGLNIGLAAIAIFAHGVRLNMLEFSNNAGVEWTGYAYRPYTRGEATLKGEGTS